MIDINKEAEEYANNFKLISKTDSWFNNKCNSFIAGHNSKATQVKIIQAQIDILEGVDGEYYYSKPIFKMIEELQQQLKELNNE
jgi:hypothetical protein